MDKLDIADIDRGTWRRACGMGGNQSFGGLQLGQRGREWTVSIGKQTKRQPIITINVCAVLLINTPNTSLLFFQ